MTYEPRKLVYNTNESRLFLSAIFTGSIDYTWDGNSRQGTWGSLIVNHNLPFKPLTIVEISESADFSGTIYTVRNGFVHDNLNSDEYNSLDIVSTTTQIIKRPDDIYMTWPQYSTTFYYRIFCIAPPDYVGGGVGIAGDQPLAMDSNMANLRVVMAGSSIEPITINHNLGYVPMYLSWIEDVDVVYGNHENGDVWQGEEYSSWISSTQYHWEGYQGQYKIHYFILAREI